VESKKHRKSKGRKRKDESIVLEGAEMSHAPDCSCSQCHWLKEIAHSLEKLVRFLEHRQTGFTVRQIIQGEPMPITGIVAGAVGTFQETPTPPGAVAAGIPVWTTSDTTNTALTPSADGTQVAVLVAAAATITTFNLSVANPDGSFLTTVAVPVTASAPPTQTGFAINQLS
jgi:hypothetical protein